VHNDTSAAHVIAELFDSGFSVPEDLSVVSYDNIEFARFAQVSLTTINYSKEALGRGAIELVLEQIRAAEKTTPKVIELPVELVARESTGRPNERLSKTQPKARRPKTAANRPA
jgi:LacI family transcriptional regulator